MPFKNTPFTCIPEQSIPRPWLPIKIINPHSGQYILLYGLIDTGSDNCVIPAEYAEYINHNWNKGIPVEGGSAGGKTQGYLHTTKIEIYNFSHELCYTINNTQISFIKNLPNAPYGR